MTFSEQWQSLKRKYPSGSFDYRDPMVAFQSVVTAHFAKVDTKPRYGVYLVRAADSQEVVYIGKAGTLTTSGTFKDQDVPGRLKAERGRVSSTEWFARVCQEEGPLTVEYVLATDLNNSPSYLEATLLQSFLCDNRRLPRLNRGF
jgi:hypothetical protein